MALPSYSFNYDHGLMNNSSPTQRILHELPTYVAPLSLDLTSSAAFFTAPNNRS